MASVLNRTTKEYRQSVHTPDFPVGNWIINPDLSAVVGFASKYWIITGDVVTLMDSAARDAVDLAEEEARKDDIADRFDPIDFDRALVLTLLDEFNSHKDKINEILDAIDAGSNAAEIKANVAAIADYPTRTIAQLKTALRSKL